jgi:Rad52/22 family double-strand break repair protein.
MKNEALYKNFESIPTRKGRGGVYPYVRWQDVADRMNEVFGTNWSSEVLFQDIIGANVIVRVRVTIVDPEKGVFFTQEGFGGAPNDASTEAGTPFKSAYSKALKDACKKWGVGLYLEDDDDTTGTTSSTPSSIPPGYMGKEIGVPPTPTPPSASILTEDPGAFVPTPPTFPNKVEEPISSSKAETSFPPTPKGGMPLPPGVAMGGTSMGATIEAPTPQVLQMPSTPPVPPTPTSKVEVINTGEPEYISDVQRAALQSILSIKGAEYKSLAKEAFEFNGLAISSIPDPDKLSYQEAVYVIKYGNDKFRKR